MSDRVKALEETFDSEPQDWEQARHHSADKYIAMKHLALQLQMELDGALHAERVLYRQRTEYEREIHALHIVAGVASKERGEWAAEREDLRAALETLVRINEEDYAPWRIEPDSELGLATAAARKALTTWASKQESAAGQSGADCSTPQPDEGSK